MRVFIFEHIVGGGALAGAPDGALPEALAAPGAAMLAAAVDDFQRAGCEVVTTRDVRIEPVAAANETFTLSPGEDVGAAFDRAAQRADAVLVIAPETGGALLDWTRRLEGLGARSLGAPADAVELCADKLALASHLRAAEVPTPTTAREPGELSASAGPLVAKPRFGAGCEGVRVLSDPSEAAALGGADGSGELVFQPWCAGRAVSVSLIADENAARVIGAGDQLIADDGPLRYEGGRVPLGGELGDRAAALARRAVERIATLRGFVGVDLVLGASEDGRDDVVIEINPRLTLSYVALARACEPAIAAALMDGTLEPRWAARGLRALRFDADGRLAAEIDE